jgi:hypothetical protein
MNINLTIIRPIQRLQNLLCLAILLIVLPAHSTFAGFDGLGGLGGLGGGGWWDPWGIFGGGGNTTTPFLTIQNADNTVTITGSIPGYNLTTGALEIPTQINGFAVTAIAANAFASLGISSVTIPGSVRSIGNSAFANCTALTNVSLPAGLITIASAAFANCSALSRLELPNTLNVIGESAFNGSGLVTLTIPKSVWSISPYAFANSPRLTAVYFEGNNPLTADLTFTGQETLYYLQDTAGWAETIAGHPTTVWQPRMELAGPVPIAQAFTFNIKWSGNRVVVIEACDDFNNPAWTPISTVMLNNGASPFSDVGQPSFPNRFYRVRSL